MSSTIVHMCINVRGAIRNFRRREWKNCCTDSETGRTLTPDEVYEGFLDELAKGHAVIPFGKACEGFDYSGGGCPGHAVDGASHE
jgi:hypothetical protein